MKCKSTVYRFKGDVCVYYLDRLVKQCRSCSDYSDEQASELLPTLFSKEVYIGNGVEASEGAVWSKWLISVSSRYYYTYYNATMAIAILRHYDDKGICRHRSIAVLVYPS